MENDEISLITVNEAGQVKTASGGSGDDWISSLIMADGSLPNPIASGNSHTVMGEEGVDDISVGISAVASFGDSATSIGNTTSGSGGSDGDILLVELAALAWVSGSASMSRNSALLQGDDGDDFLNGRITANATEGSSAIATDNRLVLEGGNGDDSLLASLDVFTDGTGTATVSGNQVILNGGGGNDYLQFLSSGAIGNTAVLDGGAGRDMAALSYATETESVTFDFRHGYDQVLPEGITLVNIEAVVIYSGSGNDWLRGGKGNDLFVGGLGSDRLEGGRGGDSLNNSTAAFAENGSTILRSHIRDRLSGDKGNDVLGTDITAYADLGGTANVKHSAAWLDGGQGDDTLEGYMTAQATAIDSRAALIDNTLQLRGGDGMDRLTASLNAIAFDGGTATLSGNRIDLEGGCGDDLLLLYSNSNQILSDNRITLDGGQGTDSVELGLGDDVNGLTFDFSKNYDLKLVGSTRLRGFEQATVTAGRGDDTFQGGSGNDTFYGGDGSDTVILEGARSDYEVTGFGEEGTQITDLRPGAPDGIDFYFGVETFFFSGETIDFV